MAEVARILAPAKLNLRLCVLAREESGYHALETLFCAVSLADELEVRRAVPGISLRVQSEAELGPPESNLVLRAAGAFFGALGREPAVEVRLAKHIPVAAGLGGGSSDAAATLRALNALHGDPLAREDLLRLGAELGSDVPFFLCGSPYALAWSRGERLLALPALPVRPVLIAHPRVPLPTGEAFRALAERRAGGHRIPASVLDANALKRWDSLAGLATNDFQEHAGERVSSLGAARRALQDAGASIALLSGSGAALFGVFDSTAARDRARERITLLGYDAWPAETLQSTPAPQVDPLETLR